MEQYTYSAEELKKQCHQAIADFESELDAICSGCEHVFDRFVQAENKLEATQLLCEFPQHVSPKDDVRQASIEAEKAFADVKLNCLARVDLYTKLKACQVEEKDAYYWRLVLQGFERNGLALPEEKRLELLAKQKRIVDLCLEMSQCLNEDKSTISVSRQDLDGMPDSFVDGLDKQGDLYTLTSKYNHAVPIMDFCSVEETRKRMDLMFGSRASANARRFQELIKLRHEVAQLLGYNCFADYALEPRMAKQVSNVMDMYDRLVPKIEIKAKQELAELVELAGTDITSWNLRYWQAKRLETCFQVDKQRVSQYLLVDRVLQSTLELYQELLNLEFTKIPAMLWHSDVQAYEVREGKELIGHFFLDLHPRENKYSHAAEFPLRKAVIGQTASAALVCNFSRGTLQHHEFVTMYHEFGHLMHELLGKSRFSRLAGTSVERDFVESPSQMIENFCWQASTLKRVGFDAAGEPMPDDLIAALIATKAADAGLNYLRQAFFGKVDLAMHSSDDEPLAIYEQMLTMTLVKQQPAPRLCAWNHMFGGYEAGYYGYLMALINATDMFESFGNDVLERAKEYRRCILDVGGNRPAIDSITEFLGRAPSVAAFCRSIGIAE